MEKNNTQNSPLAYFITFTTYGTWLRGDSRGSADKHQIGIQPPDEQHRQSEFKRLKHAPVVFNEQQRNAVEAAICEVCKHRNWNLQALNVRTNHVHLVVAAPVGPDKVMGDCKSYATRRLRESGLATSEMTLWTEGGSKRWLNDDQSVLRACDYVINQ